MSMLDHAIMKAINSNKYKVDQDGTIFGPQGKVKFCCEDDMLVKLDLEETKSLVKVSKFVACKKFGFEALYPQNKIINIDGNKKNNSFNNIDIIRDYYTYSVKEDIKVTGDKCLEKILAIEIQVHNSFGRVRLTVQDAIDICSADTDDMATSKGLDKKSIKENLSYLGVNIVADDLLYIAMNKQSMMLELRDFKWYQKYFHLIIRTDNNVGIGCPAYFGATKKRYVIIKI